MTRRHCLLAPLLAAVGAGAAPDQAESRHTAREETADTNPNSRFWRGAPAVFLESDSRGNPKPEFRSEVRSRWTGSDL
jgi:hypothetical protein